MAAPAAAVAAPTAKIAGAALGAMILGDILGAIFGRTKYGPKDPRTIGTGGVRGLRELSLYQIYPMLDVSRRSAAAIEEAFLGQVGQPGASYGAAKEAALGAARTLFAPGGEVSTLLRRARGQAVEQGFAPEAAEGAERGILLGATQRVGDVFAQEAGRLEAQRLAAFGEAYRTSQERTLDLLASLFTSVASAEQLALAQKAARKKFLGIF